jgi:hypothetical protein
LYIGFNDHGRRLELNSRKNGNFVKSRELGQQYSKRYKISHHLPHWLHNQGRRNLLWQG